jgi:NADH-quinone oxidoreductase E subunit
LPSGAENALPKPAREEAEQALKLQPSIFWEEKPMQKRISNLPFHDTPEQAQKLDEVIGGLKGQEGAVMPALHQAQEIYGYLPLEVQQKIAKGLNVPLEEVYGVSTFYSQFSLTPKGRNHISVCLGTACYVKGADKVLDRIQQKLGINPEECTEDGAFSLTACRCIGACGLAPVMTVNEDVYGRLEPEEVDSILAKYME